ncbi:hypothetical protein CHS0354_006349 [Potamilus streckersoni]|uniref:PA domain-containing protein n=1 Tax=Potamilus streckersoni TaxID=2493646 RepID=A0AAE0SVF7_9BIVA|nr:hypothetical protein CHS0354_006349 [Potamilus streckersoni]
MSLCHYGIILQFLLCALLLSLNILLIECEIGTVPNLRVYLDTALYMEIVEPEDIGYTFRIRPAKDFGTGFHHQYFGIHLLFGEPFHGCSPFSNSARLENTVVLVERGGCSFVTKTYNVQQAGAIAAIIMDNDVRNDENYIDMIADGTERSVNIPALFLLGKDGHMIRQSLEENGLSAAVVNIPVNITGIPLHNVRQPPWTLW